MQFGDGAYIGRQNGTNDPVFWVWKPPGTSFEHWVFYKYDKAGGFTPPSSSNTQATWMIARTSGGVYSDGCGFLDWVASETGHPKTDLELRTHVITIEDCP